MSFPEAQDVKGVLAISTGGLNKHLPAVVKAETLIAAGFTPHERIKNGFWWRVKDQVPAICEWLKKNIDDTKAMAVA